MYLDRRFFDSYVPEIWLHIIKSKRKVVHFMSLATVKVRFYASLESGHTTASVALKRLVGCTAKNRFYRANRDLGRIFKTEFLLSYLSEPQLRARIRRGLLKVEQLHALARDVYYGRRGRINARELHEQMNSCSCLTLILNQTTRDWHTRPVILREAKGLAARFFAALKMTLPKGSRCKVYQCHGFRFSVRDLLAGQGDLSGREVS
jgi:hypothetical protein